MLEYTDCSRWLLFILATKMLSETNGKHQYVYIMWANIFYSPGKSFYSLKVYSLVLASSSKYM